MKIANETGSAVAARRRAREEKARAAADTAQVGSEAPVLSAPDARLMLGALASLRQGDSSVRLPVEWTGVPGKIAETFNEVVELNERMADELARLRQKVGKEGKLKQRAEMSDVRGFWREQISCVNALIEDQVRTIERHLGTSQEGTH